MRIEFQRGSGGTDDGLPHSQRKQRCKAGWDPSSQAVVGRDETEEIAALEIVRTLPLDQRATNLNFTLGPVPGGETAEGWLVGRN